MKDFRDLKAFFRTTLVLLIVPSCTATQKPPVTRTIIVDPVIKKASPLAKKYSRVLDIPIDSIHNEKLYAFVDEWLGTPYRYGGEDTSAIDCSYFAQKLYHSVYSTLLPRTAGSQFKSNEIYLFKGRQYIKEGDLLFFKLPGSRRVDHVGVYLKNNRFVHSTARKSVKGKNGVQISLLNDPYWDRIFAAAGKVKRN